MTRTLVGMAMVICLMTFIGPVMAQEAEPSPEMKKWEPLIGKWVGEEELRENPTVAWRKGSSEWELSFMPGGFFVEERGHWRFSRLEPSTWLAVIGFDLHRETLISSLYASDGYRDGITSGGWNGTTLTINWSGFWPDGRPIEGRCVWEHSSDYRTVTGTCDEFKNGKWWNIRKVKGKKVK